MKSVISKIKTLVEDIDSKTDLLSFMDAKLTVLSMAKNRDEEDLGDSSSPLSCLSDS